MPIDLLSDPEISSANAAQNGPMDLLSDPDINPGSGIGSTLKNAGKGFLDALSNTTVVPALNVPHTLGLTNYQAQPLHSGSGAAYQTGNIAGTVAPFFAAAPLASGALASAEGLPLLGKAAQLLGKSNFLPSLARRALGGATYGAYEDQDNPGSGALWGAGLSAGLDVAPKALGAAKGLFNFARPQQYAQSFLNVLSGGKSLEENSQSLAQSLKGAYQNAVTTGKQLYDPIFKNPDLMNSPIYSANPNSYGVLNTGPKFNAANSNYGSLNKNIVDSYSSDLNDIHQSFLNNPTLQNAHDLQSQLGSEIRSFKGPLDAADRSTRNGYIKAQGAVRSDIQDYLSNKNPQLADQYNTATKNWADNVAPYLENKQINKIVSGQVENPRNISNLFKNPEPEVQKIVSDMGPDAPAQILFSELGKLQPNLTAEKLSSGIKSLDKKGLGSYFTPDIQKQADILGNRIKYRNIAQGGAGVLAGGALGHTLEGALPMAELLGGMGGAFISPMAMQTLRSKLPINSLSPFLPDIEKTYSPFRQALLTNSAANRGNP